MKISANSQLGLRFSDSSVKTDFMLIMKSFLESRLSSLNGAISLLENIVSNHGMGVTITDEMVLEYNTYEKENVLSVMDNQSELIGRITDATTLIATPTFMDDKSSKYFFICDSVYKAAERIKVSEGFTGRTLKDIKFGSYTYLMGKNRMVRFVCAPKAIKGFYYSDSERNAFEFGVDIESGEYYAPKDCVKEFTTIMQVLTFIELGDIEVIELLGGRNNGGKNKNVDKITNGSNNTVFVVDSSWNKLIIRTEGFAVMGHFRLQPCGENHKDRKLLWINAFEKLGYTRRPKAEIIK